MTETTPKGWKLVPEEPTISMIKEGRRAMSVYYANLKRRGKKLPVRIPDYEKYTMRWKAMLAAAPDAPVDQRIGHRISNSEIVGSTPTGCANV